MKIGYPCINRSIGCTANSTFRLASYSDERLIQTVQNNLDCLERILQFNQENQLLFFRISSDLVPFASHPICRFDWAGHFNDKFKAMGEFIRRANMRISMHPDQFVVLNSINDTVVERSIRELEYHAKVLDVMDLDASAKIQIHVGGMYDNRTRAIDRFIRTYRCLPQAVRNRLVIENDENLFGLRDCLTICEQTGMPMIFDTFHHECLNKNEPLRQAMERAAGTWQTKDGILMVDYSNQAPKLRKGRHCESVDLEKFADFIRETHDLDFDLMLEIKDKETSALAVKNFLSQNKKGGQES